ncbi:hypothetical protein H257_18512 [Aphanomyces astaci]|uniref:Dynein heavy chain coiled coil stalk domain-containing protein n=1 Tax=Aphanomyces astaci TaxID=112090 RepID=W4FD56_APHAT|nr:hypothetical protein H257_18512 [Aphanomyces astaci]ETV64633.1 hypothetical protein H257_18512 [Aphanomyces astaci]|eukprot:XP_009845895.1 hypothetical protein H257_18512 [Aphanomyces astaci]
MASAATSTALNYPYRPIHKQQHLSPPTASPPRVSVGRNAALQRATSYESIVHKVPARPPVTQPFHALTREEMGWQTLKDPRTLRPTALKSKAPKPRFKLNKTQKREFGWNTSFPAEYGLVSLASDFKDTLSYTQHKLKELHRHKQLLQASASSSQVTDADVWRNHHDSTLNHLQEAFNCHQPQPLSDPQDEIRIMKAILIREGLVSKLKGTMHQIRLGDHSVLSCDGNSVLTLLLQTRDSSLAVIEAMVRWFQSLSVPRPYIWNGHSYLHRMLDDLNFLGDVHEMAEALGVASHSMKRNPFMMPTSISDRDLEPFRYMIAPPVVNIPSTSDSTSSEATTAVVAVAEADAFLIWSCIHLEEFPSTTTTSSSTNQVTSTTMAGTTDHSTRHHHVLEWQARAEMQLKLLSMPMESSAGVQLMDSSPLMKRKGHLPSLSLAAPETLNELIHHVRDPNTHTRVQPPAGPRLPVASATNAKYANVKPRVTAEPKAHHMKPKPAAATQPTKRHLSKLLNKKPKKIPPTVLTVQGMSVSNYELEALGSIDTTPHQVVALIAATILILVTPGDLVPKDVSWTTSRTILTNGRELLRSLHTMSTGPPVAKFKLRALKPFLSNDKFRPHSLLSISKPAAVLCAWVLDMVSPGKTSCSLHDPSMVEMRDQLDLMSYLDDESHPDVLVVHESDSADEGRVVYRGTWSYHGLTYFVTFALGSSETPTMTLHLKLFEPQSSTETQATMTAHEIHDLFGDPASQCIQARAWIELCQLILNQLDHVMAPSNTSSCTTTTSGPTSTTPDDETELWDALATPRSPPPRPLRRSNDEINRAVVRIQCATRQKQSRDRVQKLRSTRQTTNNIVNHVSVLQPLKQRKKSAQGASVASLHHHRSLVEMQANYVVDVESDWKTIEAHALHGIKSASRRRLSNAQVHDLEALLSNVQSDHPKKSSEKLQREHDAAVLIQCLTRQKLARNRVCQLQHNRRLQKADTAAVRIQCLARQRRGSHVIQQRREQLKTQQESVFSVWQENDELPTSFNNVVSNSKHNRRAKLQSVFSVWQEKEGLPTSFNNVVSNSKHNRRAKLQSVFSVWQENDGLPTSFNNVVSNSKHNRRARLQSVFSVWQENDELPTSFNNVPNQLAAVKIQSLARRRMATKEVQTRREKFSKQVAQQRQEEKENYQKKDMAAVRIQCMTRQSLARHKVKLRRQQLSPERQSDDDVASQVELAYGSDGFDISRAKPGGGDGVADVVASPESKEVDQLPDNPSSQQRRTISAHTFDESSTPHKYDDTDDGSRSSNYQPNKMDSDQFNADQARLTSPETAPNIVESSPDKTKASGSAQDDQVAPHNQLEAPPSTIHNLLSPLLPPFTTEETRAGSLLPAYDNEFEDGIVLGSGRSSEPDPTAAALSGIPLDDVRDASSSTQSIVDVARPETSAMMYLDDEFEDE